MHVFSLLEEQAWNPKQHVEKVLGEIGEGDVTVACWEPGQISPNHCHPDATEIYFCFGAAARCARRRRRSTSCRARSWCIRRARCTNTSTDRSVRCCSASATATTCRAATSTGAATRSGSKSAGRRIFPAKSTRVRDLWQPKDFQEMKDNVKRVFYVRYLAHPCYLDIIAQRPEIRIDKLENETPDEVAEPIITAAHAYQIGSARDELQPRYHAQRDLLARMPNLLVVSTNGAGFDTVNVKDCTEAGVLVVNQTGGNADAVAAHVLAMMLMLSKQIIQTNHALRRGTMHDRTAFMGSDVHGRTIGIVGLGNVGRRVAELCRGLFGMQVIACDPYLDEQTIAERGAVKVTLDELLRRADFVSINCPLDDDDARHDRRAGIRADAAARLLHHHRARLHPRRARARRGAAGEADRRRRPRRLGQGAAAARPSAAAIRQRDREPAHRRRHARGARQHGQDRRRADDHDARRQAPAPHRQSAGVAAYAKRFEQTFGFAPRGRPASAGLATRNGGKLRRAYSCRQRSLITRLRQGQPQ